MTTMTTSKYRVLPYKQGSASAKALAQALGGKVLKLENSKFKPQAGDVIINWGNTKLPEGCGATHNANAETLRKATNKKLFFELMQETGNEEIIPPFWTKKEDIPDDAFPIVCRTVLAGHSGAGIVLAANREALVDCSLYVKYIKKEDEYRVHVGRRESSSGAQYHIIATQKKARSKQAEEVNWQIRNHRNGFIYKRQDIVVPGGVLEVAKRALESSGLDFGAIDIIFNKKKNLALVLEINTAPGLEGQTIQDYANFFKGVYNDTGPQSAPESDQLYAD